MEKWVGDVYLQKKKHECLLNIWKHAYLYLSLQK